MFFKLIAKIFVRLWRSLVERTGRHAEEDEYEGEGDGVWCVIANVVLEREYGIQKEIRQGTKQFRPGAKVYCFPCMWGDGYDNVMVVGRQRKSNRYITMIIRSAWLTNWRAKLVYSPAVIRRLEGKWDGSLKSKKEAEDLAACMQERTQKRAAEENPDPSDT